MFSYEKTPPNTCSHVITVSAKCQSARGHSNKTKQNFSLTGFLNASSRASTGTNDDEAPVTLFHFGLPYRWHMGGVAIGNVSRANHVKFNCATQ